MEESNQKSNAAVLFFARLIINQSTRNLIGGGDDFKQLWWFVRVFISVEIPLQITVSL
jgi:hypothetical protein